MARGGRSELDAGYIMARIVLSSLVDTICVEIKKPDLRNVEQASRLS